MVCLSNTAAAHRKRRRVVQELTVSKASWASPGQIVYLGRPRGILQGILGILDVQDAHDECLNPQHPEHPGHLSSSALFPVSIQVCKNTESLCAPICGWRYQGA